MNNHDDEAVCINVDTAPVTALALLSLRRFWPGPVRLVECSKSGSDRKWMRQLADHLHIHYEERKLQLHGKTLDDIFRESTKRGILLIDSDVELLNGMALTTIMKAAAKDTYAASGFVQEGDWAFVSGMSHAWYASRIWMPFVWFRVSTIQSAIEQGSTFCADKIANDLPSWPRLSKMLATRSRMPFLRKLHFSLLQPFRNEYEGKKPSFIYRDTGAQIYRFLLDQNQAIFGADWEIMNDGLVHLHGATRSRLSWIMPNAVPWRKARKYAFNRINAEYASELPSELIK